MSIRAQITGIGHAGLTRTAAEPVEQLAATAVAAAIDSAGLAPDEVDGLLIARSSAEPEPGLGVFALTGLPNLSLLQLIDCEGTSAIQLIQTALLAVEAKVVRNVVCVFGDAPLRDGQTGRQAFSKAKRVSGIASLRYSAGAFGGAANYALSASRYLHEHQVDEQDLGAVAVSTRAWARLNPQAVMRQPMSLDQYLASRYIVAPLRLYDCAIPVNGSIAVVVSAEGCAQSRLPAPVFIHAIAQSHARSGNAFNAWTRANVASTARRLFASASIAASDVDVREFYDAFSIMTLLALEDYGFCGRGESGRLAAAGALAPGGSLPTNTGGGQISGYYLQGMTPLVEAILQAAGAAGERQCERHDIVLATNDGGWFDYHAGMILSRHSRLH